MSGSGSAFGVVGRGRADFRRGDGGEGVGRTCGVCFSAFVPLVSCSSVFASAVFCSLVSFCGHTVHTRIGAQTKPHMWSVLLCMHAHEPIMCAAAARCVHVYCVFVTVC